ncbi:MAG: hypothetical protein HY335_04370 [Deinococcus sp.]|nr:hypothetical protein [Deinococcus sp.]
MNRGFFIPGNIDRPTARPTVVVDTAGGVHIALTPDSNTPEDPTRPAYYAYCPANCTSVDAFTIISLRDDVLPIWHWIRLDIRACF